MMEVEVPVKSSSNPDESYLVTFSLDGGKLSVFCTCPAGGWGKLCKHKTGLIENDEALLADEEGIPALAKAREMIAGTSLLDTYQGFKERRKAIEAQQRKLKKELSNIKSGFGRQLQDGVD
jgi:uncharacterized Zn finger protein